MSVREKREEKGMTQFQLAKMLGISRTTVSMWETGDSKPRADALIQLARIFGCTVDELLKR